MYMQTNFYARLPDSEIKKFEQPFFIINNTYFKSQLKDQTTVDLLSSEFSQPTEEKPIRRDSALCIILNSNNEICLLYSRARNYFAIPGGGIEPGESLLEALNREILEETGYTIKDPKPLGKIFEERHNRITNTYFFLATPFEKTHTHYMQDELEEDYELVWLPISDTIKKFQTRFFELKEKNFPTYRGSFINTRYLEALKFLSASLPL